MKKISVFTLLILIFLSKNVWAQESVVGNYHISSGNPDDGGYNWFLLDNSEFAMLTFGQMIAGKYSVNSKNEIDFVPYAPKQPFQVFGRLNPEIKGSQIAFRGLDINDYSYIGTSKSELQPILNDDANCLSQEEIKTFEKKLTALLFSNLITEDRKTSKLAYDYDLGEYNSFVVIYFNAHTMLPPFQGKILNNKLQINESEFSKEKRNILKDDEQEIKNEIEKQKNFFLQDRIYHHGENEGVSVSSEGNNNNNLSGIVLSDYTFSQETATYTRKNKFSEEPLTKYNTLFLFKNLNFEITQDPIKLTEKSLMEFRCDFGNF